MNSRSILITGAGGFLGRHVVQSLSKQGTRLVALCGDVCERAAIEPLVEKVTCSDILAEGVIATHLENAKALVHLAGPPSVRQSFLNPLEYARVHALGTLAVADCCRRMNIPKLVYISSAEVYGAAEVELVDETQPRKPLSPYGVAKASAEMFIESILARSKTSAAILRPFSVYGPGGDPDSLVPTVMRQARSANCIELFDLRPIRDYCHVTDVAAAVSLAIHAELSGVTVFNLGSGEGVSVRSLAQTALAVANRAIPIVQSTSSDRPRAANVERLVADTRQAHAVLGWQPRICLSAGLQQLYATMKDQDD